MGLGGGGEVFIGRAYFRETFLLPIFSSVITYLFFFQRHWVVLDGKGNFASQRKDPKLALVVPHFEDGKYLCLNAPGMDTLKLDIELQVDKKEYKRIK